MEYKLISDEVEIPKNTGMEGFLHTVKEILKLPRVQSINIDARGKVKYERYLADGEEPKIGIDFKGLEPWGVIRNGEVEELSVPMKSAMSVLDMVFEFVQREKFFPIAFVTGANSILESWMRCSPKTSLFGLPIYRDRNCPDTVLLLCAAYSRDAALIDTQKSFKIEMVIVESGPDQDVEVF
jgi:hypothetical protein